MKLYHLSETNSTNAWLKEAASLHELPEGFTVYADYQSAGKGQGSNSWESQPMANLLFSTLLHPIHINPAQQFVISELVSVSLCECVALVCGQCSVKWPNDIYVGNGKLAGILIENSIRGNCIANTIIGVGLNVNQTVFLSDAPNPISLAQITESNHDRIKFLENFLDKLMDEYGKLDTEEDYLSLHKRYLKVLYRYNEWHTYRTTEETFTAKITDVLPNGLLILERENGSSHTFAFKEVQYVI